MPAWYKVLIVAQAAGVRAACLCTEWAVGAVEGQDVSGQVVFFKNLPVPNYQSLTAEVHPLPPNFVRQLMYRRNTTHNKDSASLLSSPN